MSEINTRSHIHFYDRNVFYIHTENKYQFYLQINLYCDTHVIFQYKFYTHTKLVFKNSLIHKGIHYHVIKKLDMMTMHTFSFQLQEINNYLPLLPCQAKIQPQTGLKMANVVYTEAELCTMQLHMVTSKIELSYLAINPGKFPINMEKLPVPR